MAYVYIHKKVECGTVFYVGIGSDNKLRRANDLKNRNIFWRNVVKKHSFVVDIISTDMTWDQACLKEIELITFYGRRDLKTGTLVNLTGGGDGQLGVIFSKDRRDAISKKHKGKTVSPEVKAKIKAGSVGKNLGIKHSDEVRAKMRAGQLGKKLSAEQKQKMSIAHKGRKMSEQVKAKFIIYIKSRPLPEKTKIAFDKARAEAKGKPRTEEFKRKVSEGMKRFRQSQRENRTP